MNIVDSIYNRLLYFIMDVVKMRDAHFHFLWKYKEFSQPASQPASLVCNEIEFCARNTFFPHWEYLPLNISECIITSHTHRIELENRREEKRKKRVPVFSVCDSHFFDSMIKTINNFTGKKHVEMSTASTFDWRCENNAVV